MKNGSRYFIISAILILFTTIPFSIQARLLNTNSTIIVESITSDNYLSTSNIQQIKEFNNISKTRTEHFASGNIINYIKSIFTPYLEYSKMSYLAGILIFLIYLFYFRYIDIYEHEPWKYIILTFFAGILFADIGLVFYDISSVIFGWYMNDEVINDLFYTIFVIGGIEEVVKILPLILLLRFTKIINEPIDYIVYGGVAALGFAFSENIMYFDRYGAGIIFGRALTAVVLHTSLTGIVAYGFVLRDYRQKKTAPLKMLFIAMVLHGLYDFFLMNSTAKSVMLIAYFILFSTIMVFNKIVSNSLSNSPYYSKSIHLEIRKIQLLLIGGLTGVFILQYILLVITESFDAANGNIIGSAIIAAIFIPALSVGFTKIELHPKKWKSIKISLLFRKITIDKEDPDLKDTFIIFKPMTRNRIMLHYFPNSGEIYKQTKDSKGRIWFYVRLEMLGDSDKYNNKHIAIRSKFGNELLNEKEGIGMAGIYLINKKSNKPVFAGWCSVEELVSVYN